MKFKEKVPTLYVYSPNRTTILGVIPQPMHLNINYRFNTFSQMSFEIYKYYYNSKIGKWVKNPVYNEIEKNNLIKIPNDNPVYSYKARELYDDDEYDIDRNQDGTANYDNQPVRTKNEENSSSALFYNPYINHCTLQPEIELFDVGSWSGYGWKWYGKIFEGSDEHGNNYPRAAGYVVDTDNIAELVNEAYFPVEVGDIIAMGCQQNSNYKFIKGATKRRFAFCPFFYSEANSSSCVHMGIYTDSEDSTNYYQQPIGRYRIKDGDLGKYTYIVNGETKTKYNKTGYVRFKGKDVSDHSGGVYYAPGGNNIKIISGEKRCKSIGLKTNTVTIQHGIPWWVITNIEEEKSGANPVKKVTAYSYEYTLTNRTFSVEETTMPLYIPDNIPKLVNGGDFPIDRWKDTSTSTPVAWNGVQRMKRGLINQILDNLSGWKVKYVSDGICTRYRQVEDVDNANIYTYLMNTIQKKYQCYIIFDTENLYINIVKQSDIIYNSSNKSNVMLSWRNALKSMKIKDVDDNYATALKVHSEEDTYGLGLVNPNGTDVIYNFNNVLSKLEYVADSNHTHNGAPYTLRELVESYQTQITNSTTVNNYRSAAKDLIKNSIKLVEGKVQLSEMLTGYLTEVDKNNVLVKSKCEVDKNLSGGQRVGWDYADEVPEVPPISSDFVNGVWSYSSGTTNHSHRESNTSTTLVRDCWASRENYEMIKKAAENYWEAYDAVITYETNFAESTEIMRKIALKFSLNINTLRENFESNNSDGTPTNGYIPIFTPTEALELYKYIYEADWTNEFITFNEEFSADDIYDTLVDLYNTAYSEMANIYSKPTYDFESDIANITRIPEMKKQCGNLFLGSNLYIFNEKWVEPILLEIKYDYESFDTSPMVFTTDYNRKPKEMRFYELFSTIQQVSVTTPTYTFDE